MLSFMALLLLFLDSNRFDVTLNAHIRRRHEPKTTVSTS